MKFYTILLLCLSTVSVVFAQSDKSLYGPVPERLFAETQWRYTYALHVESNTIIHKAEQYYDYFLWFRYDYTYQEFLNGKLSRGNWSLNERTLFYSFKHIGKFEIFEVGRKTLVLEFNQPNAKGTYQYHFVRVNSAETPFERPANELPEVLVEETLRGQGQPQRFAFGKKRKRRREAEQRAKEGNGKQINIELIGGGYYGGIDPVQRDYIHIKNDGRLVKEFQSVHNGLVVTKRSIPRAELEQFAEYVFHQGFFETERMFDCDSPVCEKRKRNKPTPIPLRLAVTYGDQRKVITISVYGMDDKKMRYVDYPSSLDNIIDAIRKMADHPDAITER